MKNSEAKKIVDNLISKTEDTRKNREQYFNYYNKFIRDGKQWTIGEEPDEGVTQMTINKAEDVINTYKAKMFPRNSKTGTMEIGVRIFEEDQNLKEKYKKEITETYDREKITKKILEQAENFLVGGSACFYYPQDPITKKARIISLDPRNINIGFDEYGDINEFAFQDIIGGSQAKTTESWMAKLISLAIKNNKEVKRITYWNREFQIIVIGDQIEIKKNNNKIIPFSWIPNNPKAHSHEGYSEGYNIEKIDKEINFRTSDFSERVKENTKPNLAIYTNRDTDNINRDERGVLALGENDKAEFLKLEENKEAIDYKEGLERTINEKKAINSAVSGEIKSNISGLTMAYYFSPLLDRIGLKRIFWDEAFKELNDAILKYKFGAKKYYKTRPVFESVLISDETTKIDNTIKLLQNNLISHVDAIEETRGDNAKQKFEEILKEKEENDEILNGKKKEEEYVKL